MLISKGDKMFKKEIMNKLYEELEEFCEEFGDNKPYLFVGDKTYTIREVIDLLKSESKNEINEIYETGIKELRRILR